MSSNRCSTNKLTKVPIHEKIEWVLFCILKSQYNMAGRRKMKIIVEHGTKEEREAQIKRLKSTMNYYISGDNVETEVSEKRQDIAHIWENIIQCIKKEADWEKRVYNQLNRAADNHPIITKAIIIVLSSILLGLVEDCIHDAIVMQNNETVIE